MDPQVRDGAKGRKGEGGKTREEEGRREWKRGKMGKMECVCDPGHMLSIWDFVFSIGWRKNVHGGEQACTLGSASSVSWLHSSQLLCSAYSPQDPHVEGKFAGSAYERPQS